jgi:thioredoxin-dependent peroxiredoxin
LLAEHFPNFRQDAGSTLLNKNPAISSKNLNSHHFMKTTDTSGCTKQACGLRDQMDTLKKDNVEVIGVSFDNEESHQKFIEKHKLNFSLLADTEGKVADAYGVRNADAKKARRVSFLIGKDGKIAHVTDASSADVHLSEMKEAVGKLKKD